MWVSMWARGRAPRRPQGGPKSRRPQGGGVRGGGVGEGAVGDGRVLGVVDEQRRGEEGEAAHRQAVAPACAPACVGKGGNV